jgi:hypothetical protein
VQVDYCGYRGARLAGFFGDLKHAQVDFLGQFVWQDVVLSVYGKHPAVDAAEQGEVVGP